MYCPSCFNNTLQLSKTGVVNVVINGKQMDAGRFLYNLKSHKKERIIKDFETKLMEFFEWYSQFQNREAITKISLCSSDFLCEQGCRIGMNQKFSVVDILIPKKLLLQKLHSLGEQYHLQIELSEEF